MLKNFLIIGTQRTGSTMLFENLNLHPEIACGGQWTHNNVKDIQRALAGDLSVLTPRRRERITKTDPHQMRWLGFKILFRSSDKWLWHPRFSLALWLDQLEGHLRWLSQRPDIHIIHIIRCDAIEWLKSKYLARTTGIYRGKPYPDGVKIDIPARQAVKQVRAKNWVDDRLAILANSHPYMCISYEDILRCKHEMMGLVLKFLQCDIAYSPDIEHYLQKQSKKTAAEYISNYNQLAAALERRHLLQAGLCKNRQERNEKP